MDQSHIKLPKTSVLMVSNRDYRLSCLCGWTQQFTANVPVKVPPHAYRDAVHAGIIDAPDQDEAEVIPVAEEPEPEVIPGDPAVRQADLDKAMAIIVVRNDPADFKNDSTPKVNKVIAELEPEFDPRPTATEVLESYRRLQDNIDLADD